MRNSNVFIALTANEELWDKSKQIVLLGHWCIGSIDKKNKYKVLSYPIQLNDANYLEFDKYNRKLYRIYLNLFTELLNKEHKTQHSERYWDIVAGSFLYRYIGVMYERYLTIKNLLEQYEQFDCVMSDISQHKTTIADEFAFMKLTQDDDYNLELYSKILSFLNIDTQKINKNKITTYSYKTNNYIKGAFEFIFNFIAYFKTSNKTIFIKNSYINIKSILKLALFSKYKVKVRFNEGYSHELSYKYNLETRKNFQDLLPESNEFELFLKTVSIVFFFLL